jgi:hypothetical protein
VAISWPEKDETNQLYYPLAVGAGVSPKPGWGGIRPGAAYAIYRDLCDEQEKKGWDGLNCPEGGVSDEQFESPMQIFWGIRAPKLNWEQYNLGVFCAGQKASLLKRMRNLVVATATNSIASTRETCPYLQFLRARDFMNSGFRNDPHNNAEVKRTLDAAFGSKPNEQPKIIFYGASFTGAEDAAWSPSHGRVPGVFMHAMALDNLLTLGDDYIREAEGFDPVFLLLNACVMLLVVATKILTQDFLVRRFRDQKLFCFAVSSAAGVLIFAAAMYISFVLLRFAPVNWLGFLGIFSSFKIFQFPWVEKAVVRFLAYVARLFQSASHG